MEGGGAERERGEERNIFPREEKRRGKLLMKFYSFSSSGLEPSSLDLSSSSFSPPSSQTGRLHRREGDGVSPPKTPSRTRKRILRDFLLLPRSDPPFAPSARLTNIRLEKEPTTPLEDLRGRGGGSFCVRSFLSPPPFSRPHLTRHCKELSWSRYYERGQPRSALRSPTLRHIRMSAGIVA